MKEVSGGFHVDIVYVCVCVASLRKNDKKGVGVTGPFALPCHSEQGWNPEAGVSWPGVYGLYSMYFALEKHA